MGRARTFESICAVAVITVGVVFSDSTGAVARRSTIDLESATYEVGSLGFFDRLAIDFKTGIASERSESNRISPPLPPKITQRQLTPAQLTQLKALTTSVLRNGADKKPPPPRTRWRNGYPILVLPAMCPEVTDVAVTLEIAYNGKTKAFTPRPHCSSPQVERLETALRCAVHPDEKDC